MTIRKAANTKGTRDFFGEELLRRNFLERLIQNKFHVYGFDPLETPAIENLETLMGNYGEEGDKLVFKILNSGDFLKASDSEAFEAGDSSIFGKSISNKALRYDLTIPLARFVTQNRNQLDFPFKRYQIDRVWRADRPQKGRYREFKQCDADVIGETSIWQEIDFINLFDDVFSALGLSVNIHINHRQLLQALVEQAKIEDKWQDFMIALDKLDKIGSDAVKQELIDRGIASDAIDQLSFVFDSKPFDSEQLKIFLEGHEAGLAALADLDQIKSFFDAQGLTRANLVFDLSLARGLGYYTGTIFEVKLEEGGIGSIAAGGRYDNLCSAFGYDSEGGIGISFGLDRIYLALEMKNLFPEMKALSKHVLCVNFGQEESRALYPIIRQMRSNGFVVELFPVAAKMKKQFSYAAKREIPYMLFMGGGEIERSELKVKELSSGKEITIPLDQIQSLSEFNF